MIKQYYPDREKIFIVSLLKSKDYKTFVRLLKDEEGIFIFTNRK
jgi:hypothetical protein